MIRKYIYKPRSLKKGLLLPVVTIYPELRIRLKMARKGSLAVWGAHSLLHNLVLHIDLPKDANICRRAAFEFQLQTHMCQGRPTSWSWGAFPPHVFHPAVSMLGMLGCLTFTLVSTCANQDSIWKTMVFLGNNVLTKIGLVFHIYVISFFGVTGDKQWPGCALAPSVSGLGTRRCSTSPGLRPRTSRTWATPRPPRCPGKSSTQPT